MQRRQYNNIISPPRSEAGTSMTDASSLPPDPEFANAGIWKQSDSAPTEPEPQVPTGQGPDDVDKWIQNLYVENSQVSKAIQEGIRTTDITRQYEEIRLKSPTPSVPSDHEQAQASSSHILTFGEVRRDRQQTQGQEARFPAPGRVAPETFTTKKGKNRKARQNQAQEVQNKPVQTALPQTQPNPVRNQVPLGQNAGQQPVHAGFRRFEGPTHDMRQMNDGDKLAREIPDYPTDYYLFPVRAGEKPHGKGDRLAPDMETRIIGAERHHILAIADVTQTHIKFPQDEPRDLNPETGALHNRVRIWGTPYAVERAKVYLIYLNKHADKDVQSITKKALGWAKVKALPGQRHREAVTKQEKEQEAKSRYRLPSKNDEIFPYTGVFAWPHTEVSPSDVLGMNYESLDPVRHDNGVYIVYSSKRHCFRVLGYTQESIDKALDRIYVVFCEIAARNRPPIQYTLITPPRTYCPQVSMDSEHGLDRVINAYKPSYDSIGVEARLADDGTLDHEPNWESRRQTLSLANDCYIKSALDSCLKDMNYLRMYAKLRIYFGSLILFGYKRPKYTLHTTDEFAETMRAKLAKRELIRHIGSAVAGNRLRDYCDSLCRVAGVKGAILSQANPSDMEGAMEPDYSTTMYMIVTRRPDPPFELKLEVDFRKSQTGEYTVAARRWLVVPRTETNGSGSVSRKRMPLDLKVVNLDMGVSYQFDLTLGKPFMDLDKMPILNEFVLHLNLVDSENKTKRVSYIQLPGILVTSIITKTRYPYYFVGSHYVFEITQYEHIRGNNAHERKMAPNLPSGGFPADYSRHSTTDILWGASVYNKEWDAAFAKQVDLPIGYAGDWQPSVESFLGDTGKKIFDHGPKGDDGLTDGQKNMDGFTELLQKIEFGVKAFYDVKKMVFGDQTRKFVKRDAGRERLTPSSSRQRGEVQGIDRSPPGLETLTFNGSSALTEGGDDETDELDNDTFKGLTAGQRLAVKLGRTKPATAVKSMAYSVYGDSEYSQAAKERDGLVSGPGSVYGDSEFSAAAKQKDGMI